MAKHYINKESEITQINNTIPFEAGDIIVHKPFTFAQITGAFKNIFTDADLVPVSPGTECYTLNGYNTSVLKSIGTPKIQK